MLKTLVSSLTLAAAVAALVGVAPKPASALPVMQPQTSQAANYWHRGYWSHGHWHRGYRVVVHHPHHHHSGITIHL